MGEVIDFVTSPIKSIVGGLFGGDTGGSKTTTNVTNTFDPIASKAMSDIAERQQQMSEAQWQYYQDIFRPLEQEKVQLERGITQAGVNLLPLESRAAQQGLSQQIQNIPIVGENQRLALADQAADLSHGFRPELRDQQLRELQASEPVMNKFFSEALGGVNVQDRMGQATSDVSQAFAGVAGQQRRSLSRMGIGPGGGRFKAGINRTAIERAKAISGARTTARRDAEAESFARLGQGISARGRSTGLGSISGAASATVGAMPRGVTQQQSGFQLQNPSSQAFSGMQAAAQTQGVLASRVTGRTSTGTSTQFQTGQGVFNDIFSRAAGMGMGMLMS